MEWTALQGSDPVRHSQSALPSVTEAVLKKKSSFSHNRLGIRPPATREESSGGTIIAVNCVLFVHLSLSLSRNMLIGSYAAPLQRVIFLLFFLPFFLPAYLSAYLPSFFPTYFPSFLPSFLPSFISIFPHKYR